MTATHNRGEPTRKESASVTEERLARLKRLFPEAFAEGKVDFDRLRAMLGDTVDDGPERYTFTWAGRRDAIRLLQTPTRATLVPCREESVNFDGTQHLFIEGDNLEVLKLLYKPYFGRVKMIYIDPPYNTGHDFIYPDNYADPLAAYLQLTGQQDAGGNLLTSNPETSGRYHSAWLSMMYPRLFLARQLLREDGVIFVSIDDHEVHNLRLMMNEIFGEECFKNCIIFRRGIKSVQAQFDTVDSLAVGHEYVVMYAKSPQTRFRKFYVPLEEARPGSWNNHWRGTDRPTMRYELFGITPSRGQWRWSRERSRRAIVNYERMLRELGVAGDEITQQQIDEWVLRESRRVGGKVDLLRLSKTGKPEHYIPPTDKKLGSDLWTDLSPKGTSDIRALFGRQVFDNPKPVALLKRMIGLITAPAGGDVVLDFFAGSCATAQAVLELNGEDGGNRRFIVVQLPEPLPEPEVLSDGTVLNTIADIGRERIRRALANARQKPPDWGFKVFRLAPSNYRPLPSDHAEQAAFLTDPLVDGWTVENVIYEVALKEGYGLNCRISPVGPDLRGLQRPRRSPPTIYRVTDPDKGQSFTICLDESIPLEVVRALPLGKDDLFVCRDAALDDEAAANLALQCKLKTI